MNLSQTTLHQKGVPLNHNNSTTTVSLFRRRNCRRLRYGVSGKSSEASDEFSVSEVVWKLEQHARRIGFGMFVEADWLADLSC